MQGESIFHQNTADNFMRIESERVEAFLLFRKGFSLSFFRNFCKIGCNLNIIFKLIGVLELTT